MNDSPSFDSMPIDEFELLRAANYARGPAPSKVYLPRPLAEVKLYCKDPLHAGKRWEVEVFAKMGTGDWLPNTWTEDGKRLRRKEAYTFIDRNTDKPIPADWFPGDGRFPEGVHVRDHYEFRCRLCTKLTRAVEGEPKRPPVRVDEERLKFILDRLVEHGASEISLSGLAAIVHSSAGP